MAGNARDRSGSDAAEENALEISEEVVVTASRVEQKVRDIPASVIVLTGEEIAHSPAQSIDEVLRSVPGFTPLREGSSRFSSPGVRAASLRLGGSSRVSRTLVLVDGVPLNEPFGGSVYWSRVPVESIERVEIVKSGVSDAWGNLALGGVINIMTAAPARDRLRAGITAEGGAWESGRVRAWAGGRRGAVSGRLAAGYDGTEGYIEVARHQAGPIDRPVTHIDRTLDGRVEFHTSANVRWTAAGGLYSENQGGGSPLAGNRTRVGHVYAGVDIATRGNSAWRALVMLQTQQYDNRQASISDDRTFDTPTTHMFDVPATSVGASLQWSRPLGTRRLLAAGADVQSFDTALGERYSYSAGRYTRERHLGGRQLLVGAHIRHLFYVNDRWTAVAGARVDHWQSLDGRRREIETVSGTVLRDEQYADHAFWAVSPNAGVIYRPHPRLSWRATAYGGFRAPVSNELYRPARFRNIIVEGNPFLRPERVAGIESSVDFAAWRTVRLRLTGFYNRLNDPIVPVTVDVAGSTGRNIAPCGFVSARAVCRQNRNLGRIRNTGVETEIVYTGRNGWSASFAHALMDTQVTSAPGEPQLVGLEPRHSPSQQAVARLSYVNPRTIDVALQGRYVSSRFADDLNEIRVGSSFVADMLVSRRITAHTDAYLRVQNLFDREYDVERSPDGETTVGPPRYVGLGVRLSF
ncbi:MAG TPA: TonB-dependent receptor [Vicinamibacterales bacterium]|nr:TonB-dependent receptor [Vicinamibacterales bacterium]